MDVLLIDDDKNVQTIISSFLMRYGEENRKTVNGTAIEDPVKGLFEIAHHGRHYDLILLDVQLPKLTGDSIYQSIRNTQPELLDKVLFVTGFRQELDDRFPDNTFNVLDKPFRYSQLEDKIESIIN